MFFKSTALYLRRMSATCRQDTQPLQGNEKGSVSRFLSKDMTIEDKIGQTGQIDISLLLRDDNGKKSIDLSLVEEWIGKKGVGSVLNLVDDNWTAQQYRQAAIQIQNVAQKHGRPPVIWGLDSVHGANYIHGANVAPQPLNMAATFNETVAFQAGKLASRDTRAAGINWLFSPLIGISTSPRWSRVYETFGEDPLVAGTMASAMIRGIQQPDPQSIPSRAAACAKHFVGYSMPHNGHDRSPSWIPTRHLYQYFVPPWKKVISQAKVMTVMEDYTETDGVPMVANPATLNYLLRYRLGFSGVLVTDYEEMRNLYQWHHAAESMTAANVQSMQRGSIDMSMIPKEFDQYRDSLLSGLQSHLLSEDRITVSAERVLQLKQDLNMMEETLQMEDPNLALVGTDEALTLDMTRQAIILTKNDNAALPLDTGGARLKVLVTGPTAKSRVYQSGGWTGRWQGIPLQDEEAWFTYGSSLLGAFSSESSFDVSYRCGVDILGKDCDGDDKENMWEHVKDEVKDWVGIKDETPESIASAVEAASSSDVVVIAVGEEAYAEKPGDIRSLDLPGGQYELVRQIKKNTQAKIILVYFGGRPRLLHDMVDQVDAVLVGFLAGPSAGQAIVDIVMGRVNPSGRLPISYPLYDDGGGIPYFHTVSDQCTKGDGILPHWEYVPCAVQWPFGHGLSYTTFEYSGFSASGGIDRALEVAVTVRNTGDRDGAETVMFFTFDEFRSTTPEYKHLRAFEKVYLKAGAEIRIRKTIHVDELRFVGPDDSTHYILDPKMKAWVGVGASTDCREKPEENDLCKHLQSENPTSEYVGACEAACNLWAESGCAATFGLSNDGCLSECTTIARYPASAMDEGNQGWGWNYVTCLESVVQGMSKIGSSQEKECWKMTSLCRDIFHTGKMNEFGIGPHDGGSMPLGPQTPDRVPATNYVALVVGVVATLLIVTLMRGGSLFPNRRAAPETEFTVVNTSEEEEE